MPLPMVHLAIANKLTNTGLAISNLPLFYTGSICPDAIHMRPNAEFAEKMATHLVPAGKTRDSTWNGMSDDDCFRLISDFTGINKGKADTDFLLGYAVHILTDMFWTTRVYKKFADDYAKSTRCQFQVVSDTNHLKPEDRQKAYYRDTDIADYLLFSQSPWRGEVWQRLQAAQPSDFLGLLSVGEISLWNRRTLNWYTSPENEHKFAGQPIFITKPCIDDFIFSCTQTIFGNIEKVKTL